MQAPPLQPVAGGESGAELAHPPADELAALHELALAGNMRKIREHADHLTALDPGYRPFADKLRELARAYDSKGVLGFVETSCRQHQVAVS